MGIFNVLWKFFDFRNPLFLMRFDCDCACAAAPNYQPVADASAEAARIGADLGREQLAETRRQYDLNKAVADQVVNKQLALMDQTSQQGDDYYNYLKTTYRPLEQQMVQNANLEASDARAEEVADQAAADSRRGTTQQQNQLIRQGLRYGWSPQKLASMAGSMAGTQASQIASATTNARNNQRNLGWARQMDAAGLGRNLAGASQGAYGLTINSGNSAVNNSMTPSNQLLTGMAQGAGMQQTGLGQQLSGLSGIMNAQLSYANMTNQAMNQGGGMFGALLGAGAQLGSAAIQNGGWAGLFGGSDRRLKENIRFVGVDDTTGLNLYEFSYKTHPDRKFIGVMADEVEPLFPDAVLYDKDGFAMVNYGLLGFPMIEVGA